MADPDAAELQILLRIVDVIDRRMQLRGEPAQAITGGYLANIVNNFIASSPDVTIHSGGVDMGDSYTVGQAGAVGPNSSAQDISFAQIWNQTEQNIDLDTLLQQLTQLRTQMSASAGSDPKRYLAIAEIASAETSAASHDGPAVMKHLRQAGAWALEVGKSVGVDMAVAAMKSAMGLG